MGQCNSYWIVLKILKMGKSMAVLEKGSKKML